MKAAVLYGPDDLRGEVRPHAELPDGGLVVEMAYAGVCGSDVRNLHHGSPRLTGPQVPGHEVVGIVVASDMSAYPVASRVAVCPGAPCLECAACRAGRHNLCLSRRVLGYDFPGGMQEEFAVPAMSIRAGCVVRLPDALSLRSAVLAEPLHTVINGQDLARIGPADTVLVLGLGTIGTLHTAHAMSQGAARVLAVDIRPERVAAAAAVLGSDAVDGLASDAAALRDSPGPEGWSVVIIAAGSPSAVNLAMATVARSGRILAFAGLPPANALVPIDVNRVHYEQIEFIGSFGGTPSTFRRAVDWLAASGDRVSPLVTHEFEIPEVRLAYRNVEEGIGLKTVLRGRASSGSA